MGQVLHGSARTTQAVRRTSQHGQHSLQGLATRYSLNPKTVAKWRNRPTVQDARMGPEPASTVLTAEQEAIAVVVGTRGCRSMTASRRCKPQFHGFRARPCTAVFSATASADCPCAQTGKVRRRKSLRTIRLATCTWTLPKSRRRKASSTYLWLSTVPAKWPWLSCSRVPSAWWPPNACAECWTSCPTKYIPSCLIMGCSLPRKPIKFCPADTVLTASAASMAWDTALLSVGPSLDQWLSRAPESDE